MTVVIKLLSFSILGHSWGGGVVALLRYLNFFIIFFVYEQKTGFCSFSLPPPVKSSKEPSKSPKKTSSAPNKAKSYQPLVSAKSTKPKKTACKASGTGRSGSRSMCFCYNCVTSKDKNSPNVTSKKGINIFMTGPYQSQA